MADDGNKICLDATAGCEKISIVDQYGNHVVLNAAEKQIELKAKKIPSKIQLGTTEQAGVGVYIKTEGDYYLSAANKYRKDIRGHNVTTVVGGYTTLVGGFYTTLVGGFYTTVVGGAYTSVTGAVKTDLYLAAKIEIGLGLKLKLSKQPEYYIYDGGEWFKAVPKADDRTLCLRSETTSITETKIQAGTNLSISTKKVDIQALSICLGSGTFKVKGG